MNRLARTLIVIVLAVVILGVTAWSCLALWYRLPAPAWLRVLAGIGFAALAIAAIAGLAWRSRVRALAGFGIAFCLLLAWWSSIKPPLEGDWATDVSHQVTGQIVGDRLTLDGVRDFAWQSEDAFTPQWTTRSYDLSTLEGLDLFMSYWAGPEMAHVMLSFAFAGGDHLVWSIEVRRLNGGVFSPLADLFKSNPLVIIAADERDIVGLRSNIRREDVQLYRLATPPASARKLLTEYVEDANALAVTPQFYNSLTTNCTTTIVKMIRAAGDAIPLDWRLIVNGYLPEYLYAQKTVDTRIPLDLLRESSHVDQRAQQGGLGDGFSQRIRVGVPSPRDP